MLRHMRVAAGLGLLIISCSDHEPATAPGEGAPRWLPLQAAPTVSRPAPGSGVVSDLLVPINPSELQLQSSTEELRAGTYRFRVLREPTRAAAAGEVISGERSDKNAFLQRVVTVARDGGEITYGTHRAYWHELVRGGTYRLSSTLPAPGRAAGPPGVQAAPVDLPSNTFGVGGINLCELAAERLAKPLCGGSERTLVEKGVVELNGRVDSLFIVSGSVTLAGDMEATYTIDPGGVMVLNTGRRPVFSPCDQYPNVTGCFSKIGAALQSFLGSIGIDPAVLPPLKMCIPGTPITIQPGSVFPFRLPVIRLCKITDWGEPPEFTPPFLADVTLVTRPTIISNMVMDVAGTGTLELTLPVPNFSVVKCFDHGNGFFCLKAGLVVVVQLHAVEAGGTVTLGYTDVERVTLSWTPATEWVHDIENMRRDFSADFNPKNAADTVSLKVGPAVQLEAELCFGTSASGCEDEGDGTSDGGGLIDLQLGVGGKVSLGRFIEGTWSRDTEFSNWHIGLDTFGELELEGKLILPRFLFRLDKNLKRSWTHKILPQKLADTYGTGILQIETVTTGALPDPDGYTVIIARKDTLPGILHDATHRLGDPNWADTTRVPIGVNQVWDIAGTRFCNVVYSDILAFGQSAGRRLGLGIPNYALELGCEMLVADYWVRLSGLADNCKVAGLPKKQVRLVNGRIDKTTELKFEVDCPAPTAAPGSLEVSVTSDGFSIDRDDYEVVLDDMEHGIIPINGSLALNGLTPGVGRQVGLTGLIPTCAVTNGHPRPVDITSGGTASVHFEVFCDAIAVPDVEFTTLRVRTTSTGAGSDPDGYEVSLNGETRGPVAPTGEIVLEKLIPGQYVVQLEGLAGNCSVAGGATREIDVSGPTILAEFSIQCEAITDAGQTGSVRVAVVTTGSDLDPNGYRIKVGSGEAPSGVNESVTVAGLSPGSAGVALEDLSPNCSVQGENPVTVVVAVNATTDAAFAIHCEAFSALDVTTSTSGEELDPDGYSVILDGMDRGPIGPNAGIRIGELIAGAHAVSLNGMAENCGPVGNYPALPELAAGAVVPIAFAIRCVARADLGAVNVKLVGPARKAGARYQVVVDGEPRGELGAQTGLLIAPLLPGMHLIEIEGLPEECHWVQQYPREVRIVRGKTAMETFTFVCGKEGD